MEGEKNAMGARRNQRVRKLLAVLSISSLLTTGVSSVSEHTYAADTRVITATTQPIVFQFNGQWVSLGSDYTAINYNGRIYVPARFVAENMGANVVWDASKQTIIFTSGSYQSNHSSPYKNNEGENKSTQITAVTQNIKFIFNGVEKKLGNDYVAINYNDRIYVPLRFVAENLGSVVSWYDNGYTQNICINWAKPPGDSLLKYFASIHPNETIGLAKTVWFDDNKPYLVVATKPNWTNHMMASIFFVSSDLKISEFPSKIEYPVAIETIPQKNGNLISVYGNAGAHTSFDSIFYLENDQPSLLKEFMGNNGVFTWLQDGVLHVHVSNRTYKWDLVTSDGRKDDSSINDLYQFDDSSLTFDQIDKYRTGVFYLWNMQSNSRVDASFSVRYIKFLLSGTQNDYPAFWSQSATSNYERLRPSLSFVKDDQADIISMQTIAENNDHADYLYRANGHSLLISLRKDSTWQVTGFTLDPDAQTISQLMSGSNSN
ncbi:copper amine oxidase N-terminal domain-containing protein [Collibacillus ludicampi]|nr:copper amine oxidase N-terminal domain-containing protein [Collibacillus ludicampi]